MLRPHYHVYVVELDDRVWDVARFRKANPDYELGKPFVYVGMTGLDPDVRFDKHKAGIQANRFVQEWGLRLLPRALRTLQSDALPGRPRDGSGAGHRAAPRGLRGVAGLGQRAGPRLINGRLTQVVGGSAVRRRHRWVGWARCTWNTRGRRWAAAARKLAA